MTRKVFRDVLIAVGLAIVEGCASSPARVATPEVVPAATAQAEETAVRGHPPQLSVLPKPPPPPVSPRPAAAPVTVAPSEKNASFASTELARAVHQLEASAGDCGTACRALGSMERATAHLCGMAASSADADICQDARTKVLSGRARVEASCGDCPAGPSLDPNAPIPSTR